MEIRSKEIVLVHINDIKPNPKNRNQHSDEQIDHLVKQFRYQGFRSPLIVSNRSGLLVAGHGRLLAAIRAKGTHVPVIYQDFEDEAHEFAFGVAENATQSWSELDLSGINADLPDFGPELDIEMLGIKDFVLEPLDKLDPQCDEDEIPEHVEPRTKLGDIYHLGRHRLMCGDSTSIDAVEKLMAGEKVDMVFTDPPYGMNVVQSDGKACGLEKGTVGIEGAAKRGTYSPVIGDDSTQTAVDAYSLCAGIGIKTLVFWGANFYAEALPASSGWICWDKDNGEGFFADGELAWTNTDRQLRIFKHQWKGMIKASEMGQKRVHPTQKPIALAEWTFEKYSPESRSVLDLFGGSGSTLIACEKTNRRCFMSELDPHYVDVIAQRWMKFSGKMAYLIEDSSGKLNEPVAYADLDSFRGESTPQELSDIAPNNAGQ